MEFFGAPLDVPNRTILRLRPVSPTGHKPYPSADQFLYLEDMQALLTSGCPAVALKQQLQALLVGDIVVSTVQLPTMLPCMHTSRSSPRSFAAT